MSPNTLNLYHSKGSPNSRRVRIFLLQQVPFVAGERYSAADITTLVTLDFAKALELTIPPHHAALKRWYETLSGRPSAAA